MSNKKYRRMETGTIQFGEDWPGLFLRGDTCMGINMQLKNIIYNIESGDLDTAKWGVQNLISEFSSPVGVRQAFQKCLPASDCLMNIDELEEEERKMKERLEEEMRIRREKLEEDYRKKKEDLLKEEE